MAGIVVFATTYSLILPALTLDYDSLSDLPGLHLGQKPVVVEVLNSDNTGRDDGDFLSLNESSESVDSKQSSETGDISTVGGNETVTDTHTELLWVDKNADEAEVEQAVEEAFGDQAVKDQDEDKPEQTVRDKDSQAEKGTETVDDAETAKTSDKESQESVDDDQDQTSSDASVNDKEAGAVVAEPEVSDEAVKADEAAKTDKSVKSGELEKSLETNESAENTEPESISAVPGIAETDAAVDDHTADGKAPASDNSPAGETAINEATVDESISSEEKAEDGMGEQAAEEETEIYEPIDQTVTKKNEYSIHVTAGADAQIPADAILTVSEIPYNSLQYYTLASITKDTLSDTSASVVYNRFFDISFVLDGQTIEPKAAVNVEISFDKAQELADEQKLSVVHFAENQETISEVLENNPSLTEEGMVESVSFETGSFSVFGVIYTVDFHSEDGYEFSIPGGGYVALSEVVKAVGLAEKYGQEGTDSIVDTTDEADSSGATALDQTPETPIVTMNSPDDESGETDQTETENGQESAASDEAPESVSDETDNDADSDSPAEGELKSIFSSLFDSKDDEDNGSADDESIAEESINEESMNATSNEKPDSTAADSQDAAVNDQASATGEDHNDATVADDASSDRAASTDTNANSEEQTVSGASRDGLLTLPLRANYGGNVLAQLMSETIFTPMDSDDSVNYSDTEEQVTANEDNFGQDSVDQTDRNIMEDDRGNADANSDDDTGVDVDENTKPDTDEEVNAETDPSASVTDEAKIAAFINNVQNVEFSNPELVYVVHPNENTTVGSLKENLGLECEYSSLMTESEIHELNAQIVKSDEWGLISLKPFQTDETLTITMSNGEIYTIPVTDLLDPLGLEDRTVSIVYLNDTFNDMTNTVSGVSMQTSTDTFQAGSTTYHFLNGKVIDCTRENDIVYSGKEADGWLIEYDTNFVENSSDRYYISTGYNTQSAKYLRYNSTGGYWDLVTATNGQTPIQAGATAIKIERDETNPSIYYISDGQGHYLMKDAQADNFGCEAGTKDNEHAKLTFCIPDASGNDASHKATLISAADTQSGQHLVVYQRVWGTDANNTQVAYYYAISCDGTLIPVNQSSDAIFWKGNQHIDWELTEVGTGYYTLSGYNSSGQKVYLVPKENGIVFSSDYEAFSNDDKHLSISLPGRDLNNSYTSQIASWDYNANATYGMKVTGTTTATKDNNVVTTSTTTAIHPVEYLKAQEFYFAARDPIVQEQLTEVDTVDSKKKGITIQMFDFTGPTKTSPNTDGNRLQFMSDVLPDDEWMPYELHQGLTQRVLGNDGYPVSSQGSHKSLKDIFETTTSGTSSVKKEANHLFIQNVYDETGFYKYSCFENYAYLNSNGNFSVYEQIGTPYGENTGALSHWTKTNHWNETYTFYGTHSHNGTSNNEYEGNHDYYKRGNFMPYNQLVTTNGKRINEYDPDLIELSDNDPRKGEDLYVIQNGNGNANYFFGMIMSAKFTQEPGGVSDKGDPLVYEFNGDDDLWVYVDNVLLLDMGGVHDAFRGKIDFNTGDIYVNGNVYNITDQSMQTDPHTTIKHQFYLAGKLPNGDDWPTDNQGAKLTESPLIDQFFTNSGEVTENGILKGTFKDFTTHDFKMFYMERGAGASNLELAFNLSILNESQFRVKKEMPETQNHQTIQDQYANATFYYEAYVKDSSGNMTKVTRQYLNYLKSENKIKSATPTYEDGTTVKWKSDSLTETKFELKQGQMASFPAINDDVEWYVVEVEPDSGSSNPDENSHMLDFYAVTNSDQDTNFADGTQSKQTTIGKRNTVTFWNRPEDRLVNELQIKKDIIGTPYSENDTFEYRIFLESKNGKMIPYSIGEYYQIDKDGKYVYFDGSGRHTSDTPRIADHTSTNGSVYNIRDDDTIIIKGLLEGTDFYVYERTDYPYMAKDENPTAKTYAFTGTEVEGAYVRATDTTPAVNTPEHLTGHLFEVPEGLEGEDGLLRKYNVSEYEQSKAATGTIIQNKDAKVLVKNKPGNLIFQKKWVLKGGDVPYTPTEADKNITITATLKGTKYETVTTTTYTEETTETTSTVLVDDDLVPVTFVGQHENFQNGNETVLTTVYIQKNSTLFFSVGINGTTMPTYYRNGIQMSWSSEGTENLTYHCADSLGDRTWPRDGANIFKIENVSESTTIKAVFDSKKKLGENGIGYRIVNANTTPTQHEEQVTRPCLKNAILNNHPKLCKLNL